MLLVGEASEWNWGSSSIGTRGFSAELELRVGGFEFTRFEGVVLTGEVRFLSEVRSGVVGILCLLFSVAETSKGVLLRYGRRSETWNTGWMRISAGKSNS